MDTNVLVLAYLGDTVYEYYVRRHFINKKIANVDSLQKETLKFVSAVNQSKFLKELIEENFFTELELSIIKRGRNHKGGRKPKNCDIITYKHATALEALLGFLKLEEEIDRIEEIMERILGE